MIIFLVSVVTLFLFPAPRFEYVCDRRVQYNHFFPVSLFPTGVDGELTVKTEISPSIFRNAHCNHCVFPLQVILSLLALPVVTGKATLPWFLLQTSML